MTSISVSESMNIYLTPVQKAEALALCFASMFTSEDQPSFADTLDVSVDLSGSNDQSYPNYLSEAMFRPHEVMNVEALKLSTSSNTRWYYAEYLQKMCVLFM